MRDIGLKSFFAVTKAELKVVFVTALLAHAYTHVLCLLILFFLVFLMIPLAFIDTSTDYCVLIVTVKDLVCDVSWGNLVRF